MSFKCQRGFTLIEVLVVLALITVSFTIIVPGVEVIGDTIQMKLLAQQIQTDLYWLQNQAIASGKAMNAQFPPEVNYYRLRQGLIHIKFKAFKKQYSISTNYTNGTINFNNSGHVNGGQIYIKNNKGKVINLVIQVVSGRIRIEST